MEMPGRDGWYARLAPVVHCKIRTIVTEICSAGSIDTVELFEAARCSICYRNHVMAGHQLLRGYALGADARILKAA